MPARLSRAATAPILRPLSAVASVPPGSAPGHDVDVRRVTRAQAAALMHLHDRQMAELPAARGTRPRAGVLELMEALFEPPLRAWAWIAERRGEPVGYAFATVGFSMIERAYYFNLEALFVPAEARPSGIAAALFDRARRMSGELGCADLRWQVPVGQGDAQIAVPGHAAAATVIQYVFPAPEGGRDD